MATLSIGLKGIVVTSGLRFCVLKNANDPSIRYDFFPVSSFWILCRFSKAGLNKIVTKCQMFAELSDTCGEEVEGIENLFKM